MLDRAVLEVARGLDEDSVSVQAIQTGIVRTSINGEVDMGRFDELDAALSEAAERATVALEIDLSQVTFMDSHGIKLLLRARDRATENGRRLMLVDPGPSVIRLLDLLELRNLFDIEVAENGHT